MAPPRLTTRRQQCLLCTGERFNPMPPELKASNAAVGADGPPPRWQVPHKTAGAVWVFLLLMPCVGFIGLVTPLLAAKSLLPNAPVS